jgi:flavodoxin
MNIGIIVHSQTGNTYFVGQKLQEELQKKGHTVTLERIKTIDNTKDIKLDNMPGVESYDAVIFGGWIQAFSLYPGVSKYINQLPSLKDKKVSCFLTQQLPCKWMGGNNGLSKLKSLLSAKGANILASGIVNWGKEEKRGDRINELIETICCKF